MSAPTPPRRGELEFIRLLGQALAEAQPSAPRVGFGDDMCPLGPADPPWLWTVDMLMDGVDFDSRTQGWKDIGRKAMAVNLSDCAAMAVTPVSALCALALSNALSMEDALDLVRGAHEVGKRFGCPIVGGDTNSWDAPTVISISITARCEPDHAPVRRDGARPGDRICLSGSVGGSILGRHLTFEPRIALALDINRRLHPHAMIDISDGLALDLNRILDASHCGAELDEAALRAAIHPDADRLAAQDGQPALDHALYDGEDFELIVALPADAPDEDRRALGLLPLGRITEPTGLFLRHTAGNRTLLPVRGWEHFR